MVRHRRIVLQKTQKQLDPTERWIELFFYAQRNPKGDRPMLSSSKRHKIPLAKDGHFLPVLVQEGIVDAVP